MQNKSTLKIIVVLLFAMALMLFSTWATAANPAFPKPAGAINDFAGVIPETYKGPMENIAREILDSTGTALVVAVVPSIGEDDPNDYANRLYKAWGIGKKGEDKGVLIFLTVKERRVRIETGYGVEGILPDGLTGEILDQYAVPNFRAGDYGRGLYETLSTVAAIIAKDAGVTIAAGANRTAPKQVKQPRKTSIFQYLLLIVAAVFLLGTKQGRAMLPWLLLLLMNSGGGRRGGGGDGFGGGFGGFGGGMSGGGGSSRGF